MTGGAPSLGSPRSELRLRVTSAILMIAIATFTLWTGGWPFSLLWTTAGAIAAIEWSKIVQPKAPAWVRSVAVVGTVLAGFLAFLSWEGMALAACAMTAAAIAAAAPGTLRAISAAGILYAGAIAIAPTIVRAEPALGLALIAWCFAVVWATDIAAYFTGRSLGGPKLWPSVSPKKTWSGALGGAVAGVVAGLIVAWAARKLGADWTLGLAGTAACALVASAAGQIGDLLESGLKRRFDVKDSGSIIPGHGGVLDRLDAFVVVVSVVAVAVAIWR